MGIFIWLPVSKVMISLDKYEDYYNFLEKGDKAHKERIYNNTYTIFIESYTNYWR